MKRKIQSDFINAVYKTFVASELKTSNFQDYAREFDRLFEGIDLSGKTFLDIGCGMGLSLLLAMNKGAKVIGTDINPACPQLIQKIQQELFENKKPHDTNIHFVPGSILERKTAKEILSGCPGNTEGKYDIVHAWGALHHTGDLRGAIDSSLEFVGDGGLMIMSIYKKHWSSYAWRYIKLFYSISPGIIKAVTFKVFYYIIAFAIFLTSLKNPFNIRVHGIDFYHLVLDWLSGYPYEYMNKEQVLDYVESKGFKLIKFFAASMPTGCNEYVFEKKKA